MTREQDDQIGKKALDELEFRFDEGVREMMNTLYLAVVDVTNKKVELGLITPEKADEALEKADKEILEEYPKALRLVILEKDEESWLENWLPKQPSFVDTFLNGEWPEWLPKNQE